MAAPAEGGRTRRRRGTVIAVECLPPLVGAKRKRGGRAGRPANGGKLPGDLEEAGEAAAAAAVGTSWDLLGSFLATDRLNPAPLQPDGDIQPIRWLVSGLISLIDVGLL